MTYVRTAVEFRCIGIARPEARARMRTQGRQRYPVTLTARACAARGNKEYALKQNDHQQEQNRTGLGLGYYETGSTVLYTPHNSYMYGVMCHTS